MFQARRGRNAEQQRLQDLVDALSAAREHVQAENALCAERHGIRSCTEHAPAFSEVLVP